MPDSLRWGFISTAKINQKLIKPIRASKRHQLAAVASRNLEKAQAYAAENKFLKAYGSYEALLADPDVDVVYNSLPNHLHAEWTIKACQAGKHVLCEKPMTLTLDELDAMEAAAKKAGVVIQEAFMYRHHPQTLKVKELLGQKAVGNIRMARGVFTFLLSDAENVRLKPEWGGGSVWDVGVYPISYLRTMLGVEPEEVFAWQVLGPSGVDVSFSAELRFPGNILAQFQSGFSAQTYAVMDFMGDQGNLNIPVPFFPYTNCEFTLTRQEKSEKIKIKGEDLYLGELEDMAACIWQGKTPRISLDDSRSNLKVVLACLESVKTGQPVRVK